MPSEQTLVRNEPPDILRAFISVEKRVIRQPQAYLNVRPRLAWCGLALCLWGGVARAQAPEIVEAVVVYGDHKLIEQEESLTDAELSTMLDSLCTLDPAPQDLIRDLRLFQRIRRMDQDQMVALIASLFELDTVPYALVNEINLYADQMPTRQEVEESGTLAWSGRTTEPGYEVYGDWNTVNPNAYGVELSAADTILQLRLRDAALECGFSMPVPPIVTSRFGFRDGRNHNGVDLDLEVWDTVRTAFPGVVRFAGTFGGFGRLVVVRHYNGLETFYAHLHRIKVATGDEVDAGQLVGLGGSSGHSSGSHLHFETRFKGMPFDPSRMIDLTTGELLGDTLVLVRGRSSFSAYPKGARFHTVAKGEHLSAIADQYCVPIDALCSLNGLSHRARLRVGQRLMVLCADASVHRAWDSAER